MSIRSQIVSTGLFCASNLIYKTIRLKCVGDEQVEAMRQRYGGVILATWHGRTLVPIVKYSGQQCWAMVSTSRDGAYQDRLLHLYGYQTVRGSSSARGAVTAALKLARSINKGGVLTITPDGPRGPSHSSQPGTIFIAEKSGCPVIPVGVSAYPRVLLSTWDSFLVPLPGARAAMIYGEPMIIPCGLDDAQRDSYTHQLTQQILSLETEAEELVRDGGAKRSAPVY